MQPRLVLIALLALAGCAPAVERQADIRAPAATVVGQPVSCIDTQRIRDTRVHDDYTIDFRMIGGETYRNTLPGRCPGLGFEERFAYSTSVPRLCSSDIITVLQSGGGPGSTCGLGPFVPVELAPGAPR